MISTAVSFGTPLIYDMRDNSQIEGKVLEQQQLNQFLSSVERRAFRIAMIATRQRDEALDVVQDAMMKLVQSYGHKPQHEWPPLFHRILHNRIMDWHRKKKVESTLMKWLPGKKSDDEKDPEPIEFGDNRQNPEDINRGQDTIQELETQLHRLPPRQQQAFLLRNWEGFSVAETAKIMGCSEGSVKTHLSRALQSLKENLGEHWP